MKSEQSRRDCFGFFDSSMKHREILDKVQCFLFESFSGLFL